MCFIQILYFYCHIPFCPGGLGAEIIVTEEDYEDEEEDEEEEDFEEVLEEVVDVTGNMVDVDDDQDNLLASAAKAALNLSDPLAVNTSSVRKEIDLTNKSLDKWPGIH